MANAVHKTSVESERREGENRYSAIMIYDAVHRLIARKSKPQANVIDIDADGHRT
jgi:hypothetical protein